MSEPTIDRMSRDLGSARRMACAAAEDLWALEDAIRREADWWERRHPAAHAFMAAERFRRLVEGEDSDG